MDHLCASWNLKQRGTSLWFVYNSNFRTDEGKTCANMDTWLVLRNILHVKPITSENGYLDLAVV